jgi:hypothetical protein
MRSHGIWLRRWTAIGRPSTSPSAPSSTALGRLQEGSGTLLGALAHGIPQLCLPQGADQFRNAHTFEATGAGIALIGADATTDRNAKRLAAEIAGLPSVEDAVTALEQLID